MPAWMALLHSAVSDTSVPQYIRLFLTKAVLHVDKRHVARTDTDPALQARSATTRGPTETQHVVLHGYSEPLPYSIFYVLAEGEHAFIAA